MSEIQTENSNPLSIIFKTTEEGKIIEELFSIKSIPLFFQYLSNELLPDDEKIIIINQFIGIIKKKRYIIEYFSEHNKESIYIFFFELFLSPSASKDLKSTIIILLKELIINVETTKNIYDYLYQKLSKLYRNQDAGQESMFDLLTLLNSIIGNTENMENQEIIFVVQGKEDLKLI